MTDIDVNATTCAHCGKDVAVQMMFVKNPKAGGYGILFAIISVILSYFIHNEYISTSFALFWHDPGCCLCLTAPIMFTALLIMIGYGVVGFFIGYFIGSRKK
jgi:uncharacterized membrane protein YwzB